MDGARREYLGQVLPQGLVVVATMGAIFMIMRQQPNCDRRTPLVNRNHQLVIFCSYPWAEHTFPPYLSGRPHIAYNDAQNKASLMVSRQQTTRWNAWYMKKLIGDSGTIRGHLLYPDTGEG
jgi:hypothetical protein